MPDQYVNVQEYRYSAEVYEGLQTKQPVVVLESTVIAHGLPQPDNLEVARACEEAVRAGGAVPATIAVIGGQVVIGCGEADLEYLARGESIRKLSVRDLAPAISRGWDGATTVAATLHLADFLPMSLDDMMGPTMTAPPRLHVFATGGIGGVHRGWERTLDISADLPVIERSSLVTVCAGAKSILDLPATLEWLETHGVPVLGWRTDQFPAFFSRESGLSIDLRVESAEEVAAAVAARWATGSNRGVLVAAPVPAEHEVPAAEIEPALEQALDTAQRRGIRGRDLTPFLLSALREATAGRSLAANRALLINNAAIGGRIAAAIVEAERLRDDDDDTVG